MYNIMYIVRPHSDTAHILHPRLQLILHPSKRRYLAGSYFHKRSQYWQTREWYLFRSTRFRVDYRKHLNTWIKNFLHARRTQIDSFRTFFIGDYDSLFFSHTTTTTTTMTEATHHNSCFLHKNAHLYFKWVLEKIRGHFFLVHHHSSTFGVHVHRYFESGRKTNMMEQIN